jgi:peptidylprolyl isomerase
MDRRLVGIIGFAAVLAIVVGAVLIARGGDDGDGDTGSAEVSTDLSEKPAPDTSGETPTELVSEDIVEGDGAAAAAGDSVTVEYVGVDQATGEEFDTSWDGEPFEFELGTGEVIQGWDDGVEGMKEGGRRQLTIPPDLAYGPVGQPPAIGPDATLVFVIDLISVE